MIIIITIDSTASVIRWAGPRRPSGTSRRGPRSSRTPRPSMGSLYHMIITRIMLIILIMITIIIVTITVLSINNAYSVYV